MNIYAITANTSYEDVQCRLIHMISGGAPLKCSTQKVVIYNFSNDMSHCEARLEDQVIDMDLINNYNYLSITDEMKLHLISVPLAKIKNKKKLSAKPVNLLFTSYVVAGNLYLYINSRYHTFKSTIIDYHINNMKTTITQDYCIDHAEVREEMSRNYLFYWAINADAGYTIARDGKTQDMGFADLSECKLLLNNDVLITNKDKFELKLVHFYNYCNFNRDDYIIKAIDCDVKYFDSKYEVTNFKDGSELIIIPKEPKTMWLGETTFEMGDIQCLKIRKFDD